MLPYLVIASALAVTTLAGCPFNAPLLARDPQNNAICCPAPTTKAACSATYAGGVNHTLITCKFGTANSTDTSFSIGAIDSSTTIVNMTLTGSAGHNSAVPRSSGTLCDPNVGCAGGEGSYLTSRAFAFSSKSTPLYFSVGINSTGRGGGLTSARLGNIIAIAAGGGGASSYATGSPGNDPHVGGYAYFSNPGVSDKMVVCGDHPLRYDAATGSNSKGAPAQDQSSDGGAGLVGGSQGLPCNKGDSNVFSGGAGGEDSYNLGFFGDVTQYSGPGSALISYFSSACGCGNGLTISHDGTGCVCTSGVYSGSQCQTGSSNSNANSNSASAASASGSKSASASASAKTVAKDESGPVATNSAVKASASSATTPSPTPRPTPVAARLTALKAGPNLLRVPIQVLGLRLNL